VVPHLRAGQGPFQRCVVLLPGGFRGEVHARFFALLLLAGVAIATRRLRCWREILFLTVPAVFHVLVAMSAGLNIGVRHILPLYVFFAALAAGGAWAFIQQGPPLGVRGWRAVATSFGFVGAVLPQLPRLCERAVGRAGEHLQVPERFEHGLAQQLKSVKKYVDEHRVKNCWFAYFAGGVVRPSYYGIPCKTLPTVDSMWLDEPTDVPPEIDGPVLVSAGTLSGFESGPGALNSYDQFQSLHPTTVVDYGVFVFDGRFKVPRASALSHAQQAWDLLGARQLEQARAAAEEAVAADPSAVQAQAALGDVLTALNRRPRLARHTRKDSRWPRR